MFSGNENHQVTVEVAKVMTKRHRDSAGTGAKLGGFFGKRDVLNMLDQSGCVGFRYYYGFDDLNNKVLVLVGTDVNEDDLVNGIILELSIPCPNQCASPNELNSDI